MAVAGRQYRRQRYSRAKAGPGVVREPSTLRNNMHENRETSTASRSMRERSGKAICRNPDMHAGEESDRAVVPMKLPNKEGLRLGGGGGGKSADQGERCGTLHEPDTERGSPCPRGSVACAKWKLASMPLSKVRAVCGNAARTVMCGGDQR